ncbi:RNA polymerase subunit sigma-24 [Clostridium botulinum]|uniref:RNA polymerase subunit sigma-24 n=1 Tax=Clostridium botulinum TaxID=1491 RepID=A0AAU8Z0Y8_CLOBO|nr:sigma-70 family RNA polymerase sigma factor [Clostridium sporogenes]AVP66433.1 RNA polymerase subunit sigma-24 [Clostridium botulinum]MCF4015753.1 sigma-70 family RNA polymerase sigma factor [Clostridium sporogenes]NFG02285.1 sigma-70 family RNA polymerase sigma factor [Clostridium sporogenes]
MKRTISHEEGKQCSFDCYCKRVLKHEAIDIQRHNQYLNTVQVSLSELTPEKENELCTFDEYSMDYQNFKVLEYAIAVRDELLAEALQELPEKRRDIVLLSYFLDHTDVEIADLLKIVRRTVNDQHNKALKELRERMEGKQH